MYENWQIFRINLLTSGNKQEIKNFNHLRWREANLGTKKNIFQLGIGVFVHMFIVRTSREIAKWNWQEFGQVFHWYAKNLCRFFFSFSKWKTSSKIYKIENETKRIFVPITLIRNFVYTSAAALTLISIFFLYLFLHLFNFAPSRVHNSI